MPLIFKLGKRTLTESLCIVIAAYSFYACHHRVKIPEEGITSRLSLQVDSFSRLISRGLIPEAEKSAPDTLKLKQLFLKARLAYKKIEWAAEYFTPEPARMLNGPPVPEVELSGRERAPGGLQVIEALLFPKYRSGDRAELLKQLRSMPAACALCKLYFTNIPLLNWQVWEAARFEVFRVETLGITGFDAPLTKNSISESACSLKSVQEALGSYNDAGVFINLSSVFDPACCYLHDHPGFDNFDRAVFIRKYGDPLSAGILHAGQRLKIHPVHYNRLLNQSAATLFDTLAFNTMAYADDPRQGPSSLKIALGRKLFSDPVLSVGMGRSCASCHQPALAFTDGLVKNTEIQSHRPLNRHTPTLLNAAFQPAQFADLRVNTLEEQVKDVIENKQEMHSSVSGAIAALGRDTAYLRLFANAFPGDERKTITAAALTGAISTYVRSLSKLGSRFDHYMRGNDLAMNNDEIHGFNLFMGKAKCGTCHYMPLFNGALPPLFEKMDAEVIGVPRSPNSQIIDPDRGRFNVTPVASLDHAFKAPTVRNAARTAPYMHNGAFATLQEAIDFYDKGGGAGRGIKIDNQTLSPEPLQLSAKEKNDLIAFIKALDNN